MHKTAALWVLSSSTLLAQIPSLATDGVLGIAANNATTASADALPPNTQIVRPVTLRAAVDQATATLEVGPGAGSVAFVLRETGVAAPAPLRGATAFTHATPRPNTPSPGPHALLLNHTGPALRVRCNLTGDANGGGRARLSIDVGNDTTIEFDQAVDGTPHGFDFVLGGTGATVARIAVAAAATPASATERATYLLNATFEVQAQEQPCQFFAYGQGCDGAGASGTDRLIGNTHSIELNVRGAFPNAPVALLLGIQPLNLVIPGFDCRLLVDPLVSLPIVADPQGNLDNSFFVTGDLAGNTFIQAIAVRRGTTGLELRSTNGVRMDCGL